MTPDEAIKELARRGLSLLRLDAEQWQAIADTRRGGRRFSLTFPHEQARVARPMSFCLIAAEEKLPRLRVGLVRSIAASATFDSRVVFDLVQPVDPSSLEALLGTIEARSLLAGVRKLREGMETFTAVSPKLADAIIGVLAEDPDNGPALQVIAAVANQPIRYVDARGLEQNAIELALKVFGASDGAVELALPGDVLSGLAGVRLQEDAVIEHDARWMPGWQLAGSDLKGRALFRRGSEELEVFTANKRPLEELFGVDLIYFNRMRGALVMVQYKMMDAVGTRRGLSNEEEKEWLVPIDGQFKDEMARMQRFDCDLAVDGPYRLNPGAFFFKFVKRNAATGSAGILMSFGHLHHLLQEGGAHGPRGGLRLSYGALDGHYLRSEAFVELVRSGYVGTRGATTAHMETLIDAALNGGRAVVAAMQTATASYKVPHAVPGP